MSIPVNTFGLGATSGAITTITKQPTDYQLIPAQRQDVADASGYEDGLPDLLVVWSGGMLATLHAELAAQYEASKADGFKRWVRFWHKTTGATTTLRGQMQFPEHREIVGQLLSDVRLRINKIGIP